MRFFTATAHCNSWRHCRTCRDLAGGRAWRESLRKAFKLPNDETDFTCPRGWPWGYQAARSELPPRPEPTDLKRIREVFASCEHDCYYKHKPCSLGHKLKPDHRAKFAVVCPFTKWHIPGGGELQINT